MKIIMDSLFSDEVEEKKEEKKALFAKDMPPEEHPRYKLKEYGPSFLSNAELLSILIRQGSKEESAIHLAENVLSKVKDVGIRGLKDLSLENLCSLCGGEAKAASIIAAVELGRRIEVSVAKMDIIHGPEDAAHILMPRLRYEQKEHFVVMSLSTKNRVLCIRDISIGSLTASVVHPREVFKEALDRSAAAIIIAHNHPSGDPCPSREDQAVTKRLVEVGKVMDIPVLDHIIIGDNRFVSMKEKGMM